MKTPSLTQTHPPQSLPPVTACIFWAFLLVALFITFLPGTGRAQVAAESLAIDDTEITIIFRAAASSASDEFEIELSPDLGQTTWIVVPSVIEDLGGGQWRAILSSSGDRMFFRVTQNGIPITASFPTATATAQEGESNAIVVTFSESFTGILNYSIQSSEGLQTGQIDVNGAATVSIPIDIDDDDEVNLLEAIAVHIEAAADGVSYQIGAGSIQRLTVIDNDEFRVGVLLLDDNVTELPLRIEVTRQLGANSARIKPGTLGLFPKNPGDPAGDWNFGSFALTPASLSATVTMNIPAEETIYNAATDLVLSLEASGAENITDLEWEGTFTLVTSVPSKTHLGSSQSGTFLFLKEPSSIAELQAPTPISP